MWCILCEALLCGVCTQLSALKARIPTPSLPLPKLATFLNTVNSPQVTMLKQLGCVGGSFGSLQLIPLLVSLYDWLYETQSYAVTIAEAQTDRTMLSVFEDAPYVRMMCVAGLQLHRVSFVDHFSFNTA